MKQKRQSQGTMYRNMQWNKILIESGKAANRHLEEAQALVATLPPEHRETGEKILDASLLAGASAERAKQAPWLANAKLQENCWPRGVEGGRRRDPSIRDEDLAVLAKLEGAQRELALRSLAESLRELKLDSIRKALYRYRLRK